MRICCGLAPPSHPFRPGLGRRTEFQTGSCKIKPSFAFHLYLEKCAGKPLKMLLGSLQIPLESYKMGVPFWTPTWNSKKWGAGDFWGPILDPFFGETCLERPPRAAKSDSNFVFFGSKSLQERSKRSPRGFLRASASKKRFGSNFGHIFRFKERA